MTVQAVILLLCAFALIAFFVNRKKKLPKAVFLFFSVSIIISICFYTLNTSDDGGSIGKNDEIESNSVIFFQVASNVYLSPGETRFALPVIVSGERTYDCIRFVFESEDVLITEQSFLDKVHFSLLFSDGSLIPASYIVFSQESEFEFPKHFVLKVFFVHSASVVGTEIRCVVENCLNSKLKAMEISVGSRSVIHSNNETIK